MTDVYRYERRSASSQRTREEGDDEASAPPPAVTPGKRSRVGGEDDDGPSPGAWSSAARIDRRQDAPVEDEEGALATALDLVAHSRGGQALDAALRRRLEAELGLDLGAVRVHTDEQAATAAAVVGARAFAMGDDLYFARGAYDPGSEHGQQLIAHEVAHVAQHRRGTAPTDRKVSQPSDAHEREAETFAGAFVGASAKAAPDAVAPSLVRELEEHLGTRFDAARALTGATTALARQLASAGAAGLHHVVGLAAPSPQRDALLHELTQVVAMGRRAEGATAGLATLHVSGPEPGASVAPSAIHRGDPRAGATSRANRLALFENSFPKLLATYAAPGSVPTDSGPVPGNLFRFVGPEPTNHGFVSASRAPWRLADYANFMADQAAAADQASYDVYGTDLTQILADGNRFHVARVRSTEPGASGAGRTYVFIMDEGHWVADVVDRFPSRSPPPTPRQLFAVYKAGADRLIPSQITAFTYTYANGTFPHTTEPTTDEGATAYRGAMRDAIVAAFTPRPWKDFYDHVMSPPGGALFPSQYNGIIGSAFEQIVRASVGEAVDASRPLFRDSRFPNRELRMGDGSFSGGGGVILDAKAAVAGIDLDQCRDYGMITDSQLNPRIYGYFAVDPALPLPRARREYNSVVYTVPTAAIADRVKGQIARVHGDTPATWQRFFIEPPPTGMVSFRVLFNPTMRFQTADTGASSYAFDHPPAQVAGVNVASATFGRDVATGTLTSGSLSMGVDLGGAFTQAPVTKTVTPEPGPGTTDPTGRVENRFTDFRSSLDRVLSAVTVDAHLIDGGVEATVTLAAGAIQIPSFTIDAATLTARYTDAGLAVTGTVGIRHTSGRISGTITVGWDGTAWTIDGTGTLQEGLIEGLSEVTLGVHHAAGHTRITCAEASYRRTVGNVPLTGTLRGLEYDVNGGTFSGTGTILADFGMFGTVEAEATVAANELTRATFSYASPTFTYPRGSGSPAFTGAVGGTITYEHGAFSGRIDGTANLAIPALQALAGADGLGLAVDAQINADGTYGGTIATTTPLQFGTYLRIPAASCTIAPDGALSGDFAIEVVGIRHLEEARIACTVDATGVHITDAAFEVGFGSQATGQFWGTLRAGYAEATGLAIGGDLSYQIKEGMVARGTLAYVTATNALSLEMTVDEIKLLDSQVSRQLFSASKQIPVFNFAGIGVYLDLGFDLGFDFGFDLGIRPTVAFEGLSLETFQFTRIAAELALLGDVYARLTGTPRLGLGIFALTPQLLRGGGGVRIPIVGEAHITPTGTVRVGYTPSGGLESAASVGMSMSFGISGSVIPYAELSVLDGMWNPSWQGEALTSFEILPQRELFNVNIDLGGDMTQREPTLPGTNQAPAPSTPSATNVLPQTNSAPTEVSGPAASSATTGPATAPSESGDEGPFSLAALAPMLDGLPGVAPIKAILQKAGEVWGAISGFFGRIMTSFRSYFAQLADQLLEILDGFAAQGLGYVATLIRKIIGEDAYFIVEPLLTYFVTAGQDLIDIFTQTPPTDLGNIIPWAWQLVGQVVNLGGDLWAFVDAVRQMLGNLGEFTRRLITRAVDDGWIGVKRHHYYIWQPWPFSDYHFLAAAEFKVRIPNVIDVGEGPPGILLTPGAAVSVGLYELLAQLGVPVTYAGWLDEVNDAYNDRWRGEGARG